MDCGSILDPLASSCLSANVQCCPHHEIDSGRNGHPTNRWLPIGCTKRKFWLHLLDLLGHPLIVRSCPRLGMTEVSYLLQIRMLVSIYNCLHRKTTLASASEPTLVVCLWLSNASFVYRIDFDLPPSHGGVAKWLMRLTRSGLVSRL